MVKSMIELEGLIASLKKRFFVFLPYSVIDEVKGEMKVLLEYFKIKDLKVLSNCAQRLLYQHAKELGWRKRKNGKWVKPYSLDVVC